ncbi:MAG: BrnA antitoxin family protein [Rhodobacteraceae bacterium]|nr:BrnA antitoxin family protein [Paracoccaceae bacterium]
MRGKTAAHYHYMADAMRRLEWDLHHTIEATGRVPLEWHEIAQEEPRGGTERVAIRLDKDVVKFFRSMGLGYGPRINRVLRVYMHARLAGVIRGPETAPQFRVALAGERPLWGETAASFGAGEGPDDEEREVEARARAEERVRGRGVSVGRERT